MSSVLREILAWLENHPTSDRPRYEALTLLRDPDGTIRLVDEAPEVIGISAQLLDVAAETDPSVVTYMPGPGILTLHIAPHPLYYRPLYQAEGLQIIVFRRHHPRTWDWDEEGPSFGRGVYGAGVEMTNAVTHAWQDELGQRQGGWR